MTSIPETLEAAATILMEGRMAASDDASAITLLRELEYIDADGFSSVDPPSLEERKHRAALLRAAARFRRVFQLHAVDAPAVCFLGAEIQHVASAEPSALFPTASVSGVGTCFRRAFESCVGEGVEYLSQHRFGARRAVVGDDDRRRDALTPPSRSFVEQFLRLRGPSGDRRLRWVAGSRLADGRKLWLPEDLCFRDGPESDGMVSPFPMSIGCAAGPTFARAAVHGLLELIERDAASLWWRGGRPGRRLDPDSEAHRLAVSSLAVARAFADRRRSWLIDITSDVGVPCVAAVSCLPDGFGFACGMACRPTLAAAAQSALLELFQVELADQLVVAKRAERGAAALNERDLGHLRRSGTVDTASCDLLHPTSPPANYHDWDDSDPPRLIPRIVERLADLGIEVLVVDLTRHDIGVPAARIVAPGLQLEPSRMVTRRLAECIEIHGGGQMYDSGVALA